MPKRALRLTIAAGLLVCGCAPLSPREPHASKQLDCDGAKACTVAVDVACSHFYGCELKVDYDLILVRGRGKSVDIDWVLTGEPGAEFAGNGIVLDDTQFKCRPKEKKGYVCSDSHSDFGVFKYTINVTVPSSAFGPRGVPSLDPWIVNN